MEPTPWVMEPVRGTPTPTEPLRPNAWQLQEFGRRFPPHYLHQSWLDYLYWDIELEP